MTDINGALAALDAEEAAAREQLEADLARKREVRRLELELQAAKAAQRENPDDPAAAEAKRAAATALFTARQEARALGAVVVGPGSTTIVPAAVAPSAAPSEG